MLQHLDLDLLRAFVMVAETRSFTKSSERLFRTQAAISMQIKRLEESVGTALFLRGPRGTQLTREGELLIQYAHRMLHLNDEAVATLSVSPPENVVRIGAPDDYARILLPDVLLLFNKRFPDVQLEIVGDNRLDFSREVSDGRLDLALVIRHPENSDGELLRREQLHWVASMHNSPRASDLLPLALFSNGCVRRNIALQTLREANRRFKIVLSSGTATAIVAAVAAGVAISVAEESATPIGLRWLGDSDGFPSLGKVDLVLYRAPGHQRRSAAALAEHIRSSLRTTSESHSPNNSSHVVA